MKHLPFQPTPVEKLNYFSEKFETNIFCKRDDIFAKAGGGSKARMLQYILYDYVNDSIGTLVTAGGPCSNFNRACALMCAALGIKMKLITYSENPKEFETSLNYYLCQLCDVEITHCEKSNVPETINAVLDKCMSEGVKHKFVYGGGKCIQGLYAYYDAVRELREQFAGDINHLFVACATGTTLTGICAGMQHYFPEAIVHGISVARTYENEKNVLQENMRQLNDYLKTTYDFNNLDFRDEFLLGGYGFMNDESWAVIRESISKQGMIIDPTYSGKAFYGASTILLGSEYKNKNVLFWNTGGIINLLSTK